MSREFAAARAAATEQERKAALQRAKARAQGAAPIITKRKNKYPEVRCPLTGTLLQGLIEDPDFEEVRRIGSRTIIYRRLIPSQTPDYREIEIEFDDGSSHICAVADSMSRRLTLADLETLYKADLAQWLTEGEVGAWELLADRQPTGYVRH